MQPMIGMATRRGMLMGGLAVAASSAASWPAMANSADPAPMGFPEGRHLAFEVWRNGSSIGRHAMTFTGGGGDFVVAIDAELVVKIGPVPVFHYRHQASETWRGGRFAELTSRTVSGGKHEQVMARAGPDGVSIDTGGGHVLKAPAGTMPLTHWNSIAFKGPLFNPQTGALVREAVSRQDGETVQTAAGASVRATRYALSGDADIVDWYDQQGVWTALRGKAPDGSYLDYRRST